MMTQCRNPGAFKYTWPGRNEAYICAEHVEKLKAVAFAIGLYLQIGEIPENEQRQCDQQVKDDIDTRPDLS